MFEELLDEDPAIQEREMQSLRKAVIEIVKTRFPVLVDLAPRRVVQFTTTTALYEFIRLISAAPNEEVARFLLNPTVA